MWIDLWPISPTGGVVAYENKTPPNPPHKGEGLIRPQPLADGVAPSPRVFSPLVGEMADRPEGVFPICDRPVLREGKQHEL